MPDYNTISFTQIQDIPDGFFEDLGCASSFYFSKPFLDAFEQANNNIEYQYIIFKKGDVVLALAIIQMLYVELDNATENLPFTQKLARSIQCYLNNKRTRVLVCGNVFLSGEYGLFVKAGEDKRAVYATLSRKLKTLSEKRKVNILLLKDFNAIQDTAVSITEKEHFQSFAVEPNMRLTISWETFEDYKASLKSKYRVKVNKADSTSKQLEVQSLTAMSLKDVQPELTLLYSNITEKALFNVAALRLKTYVLLKERFNERVHLQTYRKDGKLVGFLTAFLVGDTLDAHFIGMDYKVNKSDAIYPRMLNDYVRLAITLGVKEINLGRTASEIKSTLGASPEYLRCYIKHRKTVANIFFKPLVRQIKMTEYKQHLPFKLRK